MLGGMRNLVSFMLADVACSIAAPEVVAIDGSGKPPYNFVVILADDLGAGELASLRAPFAQDAERQGR
jgi:hypothetical protein